MNDGYARQCIKRARSQRRRRGPLVLLTLLAFTGASAKAWCLSLDQAVELALKRNIPLQKNAVDLAAAGYTAHNLWAEKFPAISAGAGRSYGSNLFTGEGFQFTGSGFGYNLSLGVNLSLNAGLPYAMKIIGLAYRSSLLAYEHARRQLEIQVARAFYTLIVQKENLALLQESLQLAKKQREKNRIAFENGIIALREYMQSQVSAQTAAFNLSKAQVSYELAVMEFFTALGLDAHTEAALEGTVEIEQITADPERLIRTYLAKRPDIIGQRQAIELLEYTEKRTALAGRAPSLSLSAQWRGSGNGDPSGTFTDNLSGSVTLSIPIDPWIPGTKTSQSIRNAGKEIEKAKLDLENTERAAQNQIRSLTANLQNLWNTIEISQLLVRIAEETYRLTEQAFQMGTVEFLILEDTRTKLVEARQQLLADKLTYKQTMLDLAGALNLNREEFIGSVL
ncbi:MAG: TolC family protein [Treponema sp.]|nr:TolC family protein [Treponema sp.]